MEELRGQREGKGKWNLLQGCPAPLELFLWAEQETLKRVTLTEWSGLCHFSSHPCKKTVLLEAYVCRRILQIAHGFVTCGKLHRSSYKSACLSGDWSQEDCRPGVGKSYLAWLPSFLPLTGPHGGGAAFLDLAPRLLGPLPGVQRTPFLPPASSSSSWGHREPEIPALETYVENTCICRASKHPAPAWLPARS